MGIVDRLAALAEKWRDDACTVRLADVPKTLYHYTDAAGLVGMLRSGKVWATDYRFLNDKSEIEHSKRLLTALLKRKAKQAEESRNTVWSDFYTRVMRYQEIESPDDVFVFSLSEEGDDLSQWRGYARDGQGFTIGFAGEKIKACADADDAEFNFFKIIYDHDRQEETISRSLNAFEQEIKSADEKEHAIICNEAARKYDWLVESSAPVNKHRSFQMEKEWRISTFVPDAAKAVEVKVRPSGLRLVNYTELLLQKEGEKLPITHIGIGPGFSGSEEVHAVRALLRETGYEAQIYFADSPFRRV